MLGRTYLEAGATVRVLIRWGKTGAGASAPIGKLDDSGWGRRRAPHNVLIERQDGSRVVRPFRGLRRAAESLATSPIDHITGKNQKTTPPPTASSARSVRPRAESSRSAVDSVLLTRMVHLLRPDNGCPIRVVRAPAARPQIRSGAPRSSPRPTRSPSRGRHDGAVRFRGSQDRRIDRAPYCASRGTRACRSGVARAGAGLCCSSGKDCGRPPARGRRLTQEPGEDSIQGASLRALRETGRPMTATEIQGWISVNLGRDIVRTSLAPQLSRMCFDAWLENVDGRYRALDAGLTERGGDQ